MRGNPAPTKVKVLDLTSAEENGDSVAMVYFEKLNGTVHIYRDGTVVLSSPTGTTVTSFRQADDPTWRHTQFLGMLTRIGVPSRELAEAAQMISQREAVLQQKGFVAAAEEATGKSVERFRAWCRQHDLDPEAMDDVSLEQRLEEAIGQVRAQ